MEPAAAALFRKGPACHLLLYRRRRSPRLPRSPRNRRCPSQQPWLVPPAGGDSAVSQLIPGSEVRVMLDHIGRGRARCVVPPSGRNSSPGSSWICPKVPRPPPAAPRDAPALLVPGEGASSGCPFTPGPASQASAACAASGTARRVARAPRGRRGAAKGRSLPQVGAWRQVCRQVGGASARGAPGLTSPQSQPPSTPDPGSPHTESGGLMQNAEEFSEFGVQGGGDCCVLKLIF